MEYLNSVRKIEKLNTKKQYLITFVVFMLGIFRGTFSKYLDFKQGDLPGILQTIDNFFDFHNFLGGFAPWIVVATSIAVKSNSPKRAAVNVFAFFVGFIASYYIYSNYVAGFFPKNYAMIWMVLTLISPFFAYFTWYAVGNGIFADIISSMILAVLINTAFAFGIFYIDIFSGLNLLMLFVASVILKKSFKEYLIIIPLSIIFAILIKLILPFKL